MSKRALWGLVAIVLVTAAGTGWVFSRSEHESEQYLTARVEKDDIEESVSAVGMLQPLQYVDVGSQVTGQLKTLHVQIGSMVTKGDLIAEIDPTLFQSRVDAMKATLSSLAAQLKERRAQSHLANLQHARNAQLFASDAVSEEALQQSAASKDVSAAQVVALQAQIEQTRSQLRGEEANLRFSKIHAPMDGTVVSVTAREGQTLVASQQAPTILRIANLRTMVVSAQVSEADVPKIVLDMPVYFNTLGERERRWAGRVKQILPTPETVNNVVLYNVLFDVDNRDQALKPQMSAQVFFVLARADDVLVVPSSALERVGKARSAKKRKKVDQSEKPATEVFAVRVLKDGEVETRQVEVGIMNRLSAEVRSGLNEGEIVIVGVGSEDKPKAKSRSRPLKGLGTT